VENTEEPMQQKEIQDSLRSIVETSDNWLGRVRKREWRVRLATSFLTAIIVLVIVAGSLAGYFFVRGQFAIFFHDPILDFSIAGGSLLTVLVSGFVSYFLLKRRDERELEDLSSLVAQMKKNPGAQRSDAGQSITLNALSLADKIVTLLPQLVRKRSQDSLLFGLVAFIIALIGGNFAVAILVGVIVWIYFRYENGKTYDQEISKFEEQKKVFEQRKKDFIETL
jgi:hypothetical protein